MLNTEKNKLWNIWNYFIVLENSYNTNKNPENKKIIVNFTEFLRDCWVFTINIFGKIIINLLCTCNSILTIQPSQTLNLLKATLENYYLPNCIVILIYTSMYKHTNKLSKNRENNPCTNCTLLYYYLFSQRYTLLFFYNFILFLFLFYSISILQKTIKN